MAMNASCAEVSRIEKRKLGEGDHWYKRKKTRSSKRLAYLAYCSRLHKDKGKRHGEDRISLLPDDILVAILSLLTIKEAGRSSVLSRQWRYLWTFYTGKFDLDYGKIPWSYKFVGLRSVNTILKNYRGKVVDELIIRFPGNSMDSSDIDSWVDFASQKGVQRFELDLAPPYCDDDAKRRYSFPGIKRILSGWNAASEFCSLTCLSLAYVHVTGEVLEHFLAKCHFLKQLVVIGSYSLEYLKVSGEALRLESLEVSQCIYLRILRVNADNLVSLTYDGESNSLVLMNAPRLSKLTIGGKICSSLNDMFCKHFSCIQQLECLTMVLPHQACKQPLVSPPRLPKSYHLKHLALEIWWTFGTTLLFYTSLIEACPLLSRFTVRYSCKKVIPAEVGAPDFKHECLKVVELVGFEGTETDFELAIHLLNIAISLEKLIIVPGPCFRDDSRERVREQLAVRLGTSANLAML